MTAPRFEGSYMGADAKISAAAVMECKICWTPYDPAEGDETRQVQPGTPFIALPEDWKCPVCDGAKEQFMVVSDAGAVAAAPDRTNLDMDRKVADLTAAFREIHNAKMRDVPFTNKALSVEAVGFRPWEGCYLGVLVAPWFMNLTLLPGEGADWADLGTGEKELFHFPSGVYEFIHTVRPGLGGYKGCSLFSPMAEFNSQLQATDVARAVMAALFDEKNRGETDQSATIRATREADLKARAASAKVPAEDGPTLAPPPNLGPMPSRRAVLTAGLSVEDQAEGQEG